MWSMSEEFVQVPPDSTGKKLRAIKRADERYEEVTITLSLDGTKDLKDLFDKLDALTQALESIGTDIMRVKSV